MLHNPYPIRRQFLEEGSIHCVDYDSGMVRMTGLWAADLLPCGG